MDNNNEQPNQLNIEISEEVAEGIYANLAINTHLHAEFAKIGFCERSPAHLKAR